jgi:hypothetical protein
VQLKSGPRKTLYLSLVILGWVSISLGIASQFFKNISAHSRVRKAPYFYHLDFEKGPDLNFWTKTPVESLARTCLYPGDWSLEAKFLSLTVLEKPSLCFGRTKPYRGQIISSQERLTPPFKVSVSMKVASGSGVVSALYTYSDPLDGNPHHENDFEFPSGDVEHRKAWVTYFDPTADPTVGSHRFIDLGFDASTNFAVYTIEVYEGKTIWRVNGKQIRMARHIKEIPPQKVLLNSWFTPRWHNVYAETQFRGVASPFLIEWVEISSLKNDGDKSQ